MKTASESLNGYYKTFNNCQEQGLMLDIYDDDNDVLIWACECRDSDNIMIVIGDKSCANKNDMFSDVAWKSASYFKHNDYNSAINYTYNVIKKNFSYHFTEEYATKFKMHRSLHDLHYIALDSKDLEYEDYYDLATFEDVNNLYFCDLIINNGKLGLRYSKYSDTNRENFNNFAFEEWNPDLTSSTTLMLGMQERLKNFIDSQIDYDINIGINI